MPGHLVPATVSYDEQTQTARLAPDRRRSRTRHDYTATLKGGADGVKDAAGNPLAADHTWSFTTAAQSPAEGPGGPILLMRPDRQVLRLLRRDPPRRGPERVRARRRPRHGGQLAGKSLVILGPVPRHRRRGRGAQELGAGRRQPHRHAPDKKLAPLLGLTDAGGTLANGYMKVDTGERLRRRDRPADASVPRHGRPLHAQRGAAGGALYSDAVTETSNPAVSLRDVGTSGGQAASFTYDLARSVVYTRQGNPAWAGQKRDGTASWIRPDDLFYGAKAGDVQPDWVDPGRIDVPQADEQQRLLANLITEMNRDAAPLPRFWYLPRGEKAAIVLTGDDHDTGGTAAYFDRLKATDPPGCSVADWECPRATSYMFTDTPLSDPQAIGYERDGFELALHAEHRLRGLHPDSRSRTT